MSSHYFHTAYSDLDGIRLQDASPASPACLNLFCHTLIQSVLQPGKAACVSL